MATPRERHLKIGVGGRDGYARRVRKKLVVFACDCYLRLDRFIEMLQLRQANRRLEIGHAVIEADIVMDEASLLVATEAQIALRPHPFAQFRIAGDDHAAFAGGLDFVGIETEYRQVAERSGRPTTRAPNAAARYFHDAVDPGGMTIRVNDDDCARPVGDRALDVLEVHVPRVVGIDRNRNRATRQDREHGGNHGEVGYDDFVGVVKIEDAQRQVKRRGTAARGNGVLGADFLGKAPLELVEKLTARRNPSAVDGLAQIGLLVAPNIGTTHRHEVLHESTAARQR
jgi:hypothetical protein